MNTKVFKVELLIIDPNGQNGLEEEEVKILLEQVRYLDFSFVYNLQSVDIGEWDDDNPLNKFDTQQEEVDRLFPQT
jgi:hypothetical protein